MSKLDGLHPKVRALAQRLIQLAGEQMIPIMVTQGLRTIAEQDALYAQGRTTPGKIVTNAMGGDSFHNWGVAFDIAIIRDGKITWDTKSDVNDNDVPDFTDVGLLGESIGLEWGGRWKFLDIPHFQLTEGLTIKDFKAGKKLS